MHPIRRALAIAFFSLGTVAGFGSGFAHLHCARHARQQAWEQHVAHVCVEAARHGESPTGSDPWHGGGW